MQPEDRIRLRHLREAAAKALTYSEGKQRSDLDDELLRLALTKLVEIVGEAAKSISPDGRAAIPDVPWRRRPHARPPRPPLLRHQPRRPVADDH